MLILRRLIAALLLFTAFQTNAQSTNYLFECWRKQVKFTQSQYLKFSYQETLNRFEHSFEPWQQSKYLGKGTIWSNYINFFKQDTLTNGKRTYFSKLEFTESNMLFLDYGDKDLFPVSESLFFNQIFQTARYSPIMLINYFFQQEIQIEKESNEDVAIYRTIINKAIVKLYINKSESLISKVTILNDDELYGDVLSTFVYSNYSTRSKIFYPKTIKIEKVNGQLKDEVIITDVLLVDKTPDLLNKPADYEIKKDKEVIPVIRVKKYSEHIHFIELEHTDDRVMVVEFKDFLLVAESPLNSENGELIISEVKKIASDKPIKYFVFGHYHPHYLGGLRPFVHKEVTVLSTKSNINYVKYLANASHSLNPDSLQIQPKALLIEEIVKIKTITDGKFEMRIYNIGDKSRHTKDYLIYYFPDQKLLFEDDLVWIKRTGEVKQASKRQAGLYYAIKELGLEIDTIIQSWPVADYGVKTIIPFNDLEQSINYR